MFKALSISAATVALLATGALAQTAQPTPTEPPAVTKPAPNSGAASTSTTTTTTKTDSVSFKSAMAQDEMLASEVSGLEVRNAAGEDLGDINDVVMDKTGKPVVAIIGVGGFLGLGEKDVGVPFESLSFAVADGGKNVARLDTTKEALKAAPNYVYKGQPAASDKDASASNALRNRPAAPSQ